MSLGSESVGLRSIRTRLVGREADLIALSRMLARDDVAILTMVGPGGAGKTRLAREIAFVERERFPDGVTYVDLSTVSSPTMVEAQIAQALGIAEAPNSVLMDMVAAQLRDRTTLLVLDEFEHLMDAAPVVEKLAARCPTLKVLVTSRAPLEVAGEHQFPVRLLGIPASIDPVAFHSDPVDLVRSCSAVALFCERARASKPDFELTRENALDVGEICRRLDGLPLAIEIAATWIKLMSPAELLRRLDQTPAVEPLGGGLASGRRRTLRETVAWSYGLLSHDEKRVFRRLGMFPGGVSLTDVSSVCRWQDDLADDVVPTVAALMNQSLLVSIPGPAGGTRVRMLETIREFARQELVETGEADEAEGILVDFAVSLAEEAGPQLVTRDRSLWLRRLEEEEGNLRAALTVCVANDWGEPAMRIMAALWHRYRFRFREALEWLDVVLSLPSAQAPSLARAGALHSAAIAMWAKGDYPAVKRLATESVAMARQFGDSSLTAIATCLVGAGAENREAMHEAFQDALATAAMTQESWPAERCYRAYASCALRFGDPEVALEMATKILETGDPQNTWSRAMGLSLGGQARLNLGQTSIAKAELQSAIAGLQEAQDRWALVYAMISLGVAAALEGEWAEATTMFADAANRSLVTTEMPSVATALEGLAVCFAVAAMATERDRALLGANAAAGRAVHPLGLPESWHSAVTDARRGRVEPMLGDGQSVHALVRQCVADGENLAARLHRRASRRINNEHGLSERELEVLRLMAIGSSNKDIAERLFLSVRTVEKHVANIYAKAEVKNRAEAALLATRMGLLQ